MSESQNPQKALSGLRAHNATESRKAKLRRVLYILLAICLFIGTPFLLTWVAIVTGVAAWSSIYGPLVFFNDISGRGFIIGFIFIISLVGGMMYLLMRAFDVQEGAW